MPWRSPRHTLLLCAGIDLLGLISLVLLQMALRQLPLGGQLGWLAALAATYLTLGWLFGTFSLLSWRRVPTGALLRRQGAVLLGMIALVALSQWLLNPSATVWLVWRSSQWLWLLPMGVWSVLVRLALRRGTLLADEPQVLLLATEQEAQRILAEWRRTPCRLQPRWLPPEEALAQPGPLLLAVSPVFQQSPDAQVLLAEFERRDPRQFVLTTPLVLAERQLERLPPALVPESWLSYDAIPWNDELGLQRQLKRVADVLLSGGLLLITSPLLLLAALLIRLDDGGPVFYAQQRSGWLGEPFTVWKLRSMTELPHNTPARWTVPGDHRITRVGLWLRRTRLDELPQLLNVLRGEMSLIGPRPERPELERDLEVGIRHYRKRHWMRPGLSGWAQVSAPYAASVEDSELKLSYDLYYIKHFSIWLDLVVLLRTLKTLLKVEGQ